MVKAHLIEDQETIDLGDLDIVHYKYENSEVVGSCTVMEWNLYIQKLRLQQLYGVPDHELNEFENLCVDLYQD